MNMNKAPKLKSPKPLVVIKGHAMSPIYFDNEGGGVVSCKVAPDLPTGLVLKLEKNTCVLTGKPYVVVPQTEYQVTAYNAQGEQCVVTLDLAVQEAPIREQRGEILKVHDDRSDLDTPRSQVAHAIGDHASLGSMIKPHEKFMMQPMGDDSHLTAQAANNVDAEQRAQASPELTPAPSAQQQYNNVLAANPNITPTPNR